MFFSLIGCTAAFSILCFHQSMDSNGEEEGGNQGKETRVLARGGPIYFPNTTGTLVRPLAFQNRLLHELQALNNELAIESNQEFTIEDLSLNELKVYTDEELVDTALREAFKDQKDDEYTKQRGGSKRRRTSRALKEITGDHENLPDSSELSTLSISEDLCNGIKNKSKISRKTKHSKEDMEEINHAKIEELVKLKEKQDNDRELATHVLHSLKRNEGAMPAGEGFERISSIMSSDSVRKHPNASEVHDHVAVNLPESLLCVEVYENKLCGEKTQEFVVLGCQLLTEMKDMIGCITDKIMKKEDLFDPSGYFLVEDVFYNDLRNETATDYSEPIFNWLNNSRDDALQKWGCVVSGELKKKQKEVVGEVTPPSLPQFKRANMHKTRFCDLNFRLGAGYLYCHQGDCKHTIVFRDLRMIHPEDVQNRAAYPICFQKKSRVLKCHVCGIHKATKVTLNDKWAKFNPCHFCDGCYFYLHYSGDGSLLYSDFSVYDCTSKF